MLVHKFIFMEGRKALLSDDKHFPRLLKSDTNVAVNVDAVIILPVERMGGLGGLLCSQCLGNENIRIDLM